MSWFNNKKKQQDETDLYEEVGVPKEEPLGYRPYAFEVADEANAAIDNRGTYPGEEWDIFQEAYDHGAPLVVNPDVSTPHVWEPKGCHDSYKRYRQYRRR